jgi:hypothetical protein
MAHTKVQVVVLSEALVRLSREGVEPPLAFPLGQLVLYQFFIIQLQIKPVEWMLSPSKKQSLLESFLEASV